MVKYSMEIIGARRRELLGYNGDRPPIYKRKSMEKEIVVKPLYGLAHAENWLKRKYARSKETHSKRLAIY